MIIRVASGRPLGPKRLDAITNEEVQRLKRRLLRNGARRPSTTC